MSRIEDMPYYVQRQEQVEATLYNLWRRARLHLPLPARFILPRYPGVVMIVESRAWICADIRQHDLPILAWTDFQDRGRSALHLPVRCRLNYYHFAASRYRALALASMAAGLRRRLGDSGMPGRG